MTAPASHIPDRPATRAEALQACVTEAVAGLGARYRADVPSAVAALSRMRRAVSAEPGSEPSVWAETIGLLPPRLVGRTDTPNDAERAVHAAMCLFAVHQQSQTAAMHTAYRGGLGRAVRLYSRRTASEEATRRRFHALGTAASLPETMHHLRGLVTQLRTEKIPLDYGQLARDLLDLQNPARAGAVRLHWGRDYHRQDPAEAVDVPTDAPTDSPATD